MTQTINVHEIAALQYDCILSWQKEEIQLGNVNFLALVEENHAFNYRLWHAEDRARRDDLGYEYVYQAKREIDHYNQQRNNRMEAMDTWIVTNLHPASASECPVHSETPGMIIDRLSILTLKAYYMHLQSRREDVDEQHQKTCKDRWQIIIEQHRQLLHCLGQLLNEIRLKQRTFRSYYQFKMYNDPNLNPALYGAELQKNSALSRLETLGSKRLVE